MTSARGIFTGRLQRRRSDGAGGRLTKEAPFSRPSATAAPEICFISSAVGVATSGGGQSDATDARRRRRRHHRH